MESSSRMQIFLVHLHRSAWAFSWARRAPARLQKPRWSVALPAKALTQQVLRKCTRAGCAVSCMRGGVLDRLPRTAYDRPSFLVTLPESIVMTALVIDRLTKNFGGLQALHDLSLDIQPGERRVILGPNGAGKTTLFHLIGGQLSPSSGRIFLHGQEVTHLPPFRRAALGLARTFQLTTLFPNLTVLENMVLAVQALDTVRFVLYRPLTSYQYILSKAPS